MLKKIFISAILLIAVLSFVVSLLSGKNNDEKVIAAPADRVAVINIEGTIVSGEPGENIWGETTGASSGRLMREIREAAADSSVKALVLRINSPGGSVTAAEEVGRELKRFKETTDKPIITSMGDSAASAAYWLAAYSDTIYANPSTLTGSIGVYMPYMNTQELFKKIGIYTTKTTAGRSSPRKISAMACARCVLPCWKPTSTSRSSRSSWSVCVSACSARKSKNA